MSSPAVPPPERAATRAAFVFILITVAFDMLAFGIIAPVLPNLILQMEGGSMARASAVTGYFGFAWATMQFIFSPILGAWSDRFGRRPVILISCLGLGLDYIFMALAPSLRWLFVGRIISGITTSNISSAFAYVTDVTPPEKRAKQFGMVGAVFGLGFVVGPAVGGFLGGISLRAPFWAAAILSLANVLYGFFILPESLPKEKRAKSAWQMANPLGSLTLLRSHPELAGLSAAMTLFYLAHNALPSVFVLYTEYRYGWNERDVGLSLTVVGVFAATVSGGLVGPYVKRFGEKIQFIVGLGVRDFGIRGICAGLARFAAAGEYSVYCVVGRGGAGDAIVDVAAGGSNVAGEAARGDQFPAGNYRDDWAVDFHAGFCVGDCQECCCASAGGALFAGGGFVGREFADRLCGDAAVVVGNARDGRSCGSRHRRRRTLAILWPRENFAMKLKKAAHVGGFFFRYSMITRSR